jgi:hypothetical protein
MRDVEAHHRDREAGIEHDGGGLRVGVDVELGGHGRVALADRAAHEADVGDVVGQRRMEAEEQRDVRQRPDRCEHDRIRVGAEERGDEVHRALRAGVLR